MARRRPVAALLGGLAVCTLLVACGEPPPEPVAEPEGAGPARAPGNPEGRFYERSFVFIEQTGDSLFLVPWLTRTTAYPDTVQREAAAWLARGGTWEAFYAEKWGTPPTRVPARILPHGSLTIVVREGDAVDGLIFEEGPRSLEVAMSEVRSTWTGSRGEAFELVEAAAYLSERRVEGLLLDMARAWPAGAPAGGDWAILVSGDSLQVVLAADIEQTADSEPRYGAWVRGGDDEAQWTDVRATWEETQAFPPARRDVPIAWSIRSADGTLQGSLEARSSEILAGEGEGPLLPVRALMAVSGEISTGAGVFPVAGLLVHERR